MKIKIKIAIICVFLLTLEIGASKKWGATGHRTIGDIAETHLKRSTKKAIDKLLNGKSLAFVSTFADEIKSDSIYNKYFTWYFANLEMDETYATSNKHPDGDIITGINLCISVLKDKNATAKEKAFYLKFLVHLVGDLHQPMHAGLESDLGGNQFVVQWFYNGSNLHRVWDSNMINQYGMSYSELASNATYFTKKVIKRLQKGSVESWFDETHEITKEVYQNVKQNDNLRYRYSYDNFPIVRKQLQIAGIRLAKVLNDVF